MESDFLDELRAIFQTLTLQYVSDSSLDAAASYYLEVSGDPDTALTLPKMNALAGGVRDALKKLIDKLIPPESEEAREPFLSKVHSRVSDYLDRYGVDPQGPDLIKYADCFGFVLADQAREFGWQGPHLSVIRFLRILVLEAYATRASGFLFNEAMRGKLIDLAQDGVEQEYLGAHGLYMIFKNWSLIGPMVRTT